MSISYKFYSWFSSSDSKGKEWTYIYSENINTFSSEYIEVSPKTKTLISTGEKIDYLVPSYEVNNDFYFVRPCQDLLTLYLWIRKKESSTLSTS